MCPSLALTLLGELLFNLCITPVPRRRGESNKLKISMAIVILKNLKLPPTIQDVSKVTGIPKQRVSEIKPSELLCGCYRVDKLPLKHLLDSMNLIKVKSNKGKFEFRSRSVGRPRRKKDERAPSKAKGSRGKHFSVKKTEQLRAYEQLRSKQLKEIEDKLKRIARLRAQNPAAAGLIYGAIMHSQIIYREILTHPHAIEHLEKWYKILEPIGRKALHLAREREDRCESA